MMMTSKHVRLIGRRWRACVSGWCRLMPVKVLLVVPAVVAGVITGAMAHVLKRLVALVSDGVTGGLDAERCNIVFLLLPVAGIVLAGLLQRYVFRRELYHGVDRLDRSLAARRYRLPFELTFAPVLASSVTLGFGGSAGSEGPIAYTGAAIGSNLGRALGLSPSQMRVMIACGASAGIAGIFKAPVGGALFSFEVLCVGLSAPAIVAVFAASVSAALTAYLLSGRTPDISFSGIEAVTPDCYLWIVLLGVACGVYSAYYSHIMRVMTRLYAGFADGWIKNVIAGGVIAVAVFMFPALYGEGYGFMAKVLGNGESFSAYSMFAADGSGALTPLLMAAGILAVKAFATSSTNSGGGVAGDFAPTLFAGCIAGYLFASALNEAFGLSLPVADFAFMGMGAVMAGAIQAPLMAMFLTVEMATGGYSMLLPVAVASTVSYCVVRVLHVCFGHKFRWVRS